MGVCSARNLFREVVIVRDLLDNYRVQNYLTMK